jgi:diacylglycerol kinase family enzyme
MLVTHKPFHEKRIEVFKTKTVEMHLKRKAYFQVDGEYIGKTVCVKARILPQIVNVVLPQGKELA